MEDAIKNIREQFPALKGQMNGEPLVYLDNAATTQKPKAVLEVLREMNEEKNANVHRAMYALSDEATSLYEGAREEVRKYINAKERGNIIFTSGTTASINLAAYCFCKKFLRQKEAIVVTADSHHSNLVPWQIAAESAGAEVRILPINKTVTTCGSSSYIDGRLLLEELEPLLDEKVKIVAATHISNVLGIVNPVEKIIKIAHSHNIPVLIDGAQGIVHQKVDMQRLDCDFYAFSGHKIYGETGVGILYGKRKWLEQMPPFMGGGDMVGTVTYKKTTYAELPLKYEAGTPNFIGAASLAPALQFMQSLPVKAISHEAQKIKEYLQHALLEEVGDVILYGAEGLDIEKIPLFSFNIKGCNAGDVAQLLDKQGIAVRSGLMCAEPLLNSMGANSVIRASFAVYNTFEEAEKLIEGVKKAKKMLL